MSGLVAAATAAELPPEQRRDAGALLPRHLLPCPSAWSPAHASCEGAGRAAGGGAPRLCICCPPVSTLLGSASLPLLSEGTRNGRSCNGGSCRSCARCLWVFCAASSQFLPLKRQITPQPEYSPTFHLPLPVSQQQKNTFLL
jgi:hypothetical protein